MWPTIIDFADKIYGRTEALRITDKMYDADQFCIVKKTFEKKKKKMKHQNNHIVMYFVVKTYNRFIIFTTG